MQEDPLIISEAEESNSSSKTNDVKEQRVSFLGSWRKIFSKKFFLRGVAALSILLFCIGIAGLFIERPYVVIMPGGAEDTESFLQIEGAPSYPSEGEILLTTVRQRVSPNVWEYLWIKNFDDHSRIVPYEDYFPTEKDADENDDINVGLMVDSQALAKGVALEKLGYSDALLADGIWVDWVDPNSVAHGVLRAADKVEAVDGLPVANANDFVETVSGYAPGDEVTMVVERIVDSDIKKLEVSVSLGENPEDSTKPYLGILLVDSFIFNSNLPVDVKIDAAKIGGPSGGLALSLAILDAFTEGDLLGGKRIAFTGTIQADGSVFPVGGVPQKSVAVRDAGIEVFIVPDRLADEEYQKIEQFVGDDLQIVQVGSLDEALEQIDKLGGDVDSIEEFAAANRAAGIKVEG